MRRSQRSAHGDPCHHGPIDATPPTWGWRLASGNSPTFTLRRIGTLADAPLPADQPEGVLTWQIRDGSGRPTGVPVAIGDKLAWVGFGANAFEVLFREAAGGTTSFASNVGNEGTFNMGVNDGAVPQAQFVLEPDADGDRYGDESQDGCIANGLRQDDCVAPVITFNKTPRTKTSSSKARFNFSANETATFECSLDKEGLKDCSGSERLKKLSERKHTFRVRATDSNGNLGSASFRWRVK